jgi:hypothetical protein
MQMHAAQSLPDVKHCINTITSQAGTHCWILKNLNACKQYDGSPARRPLLGGEACRPRLPLDLACLVFIGCVRFSVFLGLCAACAHDMTGVLNTHYMKHATAQSLTSSG